MDPLGALLFALIAGHFAKNAVVDTAAAVKGKTPPSHERWMQRRTDRGQSTRRKGNGPFRKWASTAWADACETWAERSHARHQRHMAWLRDQERTGALTDRYLQRQRTKMHRRAARRQWAAATANVAWESAKDRARRAAHRGHGSSEQPAGQDGETAAGTSEQDTTGATTEAGVVLPFQQTAEHAGDTAAQRPAAPEAGQDQAGPDEPDPTTPTSATAGGAAPTGGIAMTLNMESGAQQVATALQSLAEDLETGAGSCATLRESMEAHNWTGQPLEGADTLADHLQQAASQAGELATMIREYASRVAEAYESTGNSVGDKQTVLQ